METRIALIHDPLFLEHRTPGGGIGGSDHPERPERLSTILDWLRRDGLIDQLREENPPAATAEDLTAVHTAAHVEAVRVMAEDRGGGFFDPDTYAAAASYQAAVHAAGAAIRGVDLVLDGEVERAFTLARPPGHHATAERAMGFCLFNSIAVAAAHARRRGLQRVFIVDWDVHHGNGTQDIFYDDPAVTYFSTHQWPHYPGTGRISDIGKGKAGGSTINVPLPPGTGDDGYRRIFEEVLAPAMRRCEPELILVSAGYDAHAADPLAGMLVSTAGFGAMAQITVELANELCDGKVVACLEGGYHLDALGDSVLETLRVFRGEAPRELVRAGGDDRSGVDPSAGDDTEIDAIDTIVKSVQATHLMT